jgi:hypothetical protein
MGRQLVLVREAKLASLLAGAGGDRLEASGVLAADGRFYVLVEARPRGRGFMAEVQEYDERFGYLERAWLQFPLEGPNKGLEGLTCVHRDGRTYLLGLCEGNRCRDGAEGRRPGGGRVQVFERGRHHWDRVATIRLPATLPFEDFSSLAVAGDRLAVLSQASSALWVGRLRTASWEVAGQGAVFELPPDPQGRAVYCNVEGGLVAVGRHRGRGIRQGQAQRPGPALPSQGPVDPCLHHPRRRLSGPPSCAPSFSAGSTATTPCWSWPGSASTRPGWPPRSTPTPPTSSSRSSASPPNDRTFRSCTSTARSTCSRSGAGPWSRRSRPGSTAGSPAWSSTTR